MLPTRACFHSRSLLLAIAAIPLLAPQTAVAQGTTAPTIAQPVVQQIPGSGSMKLNAALARLGKDPRDVAALIDAGKAALEMGDADAAIGFFQRADSLSPGSAAVKAGLAGAYVRKEDPFTAIPLFIEAERIGPIEPALLLDRGLAYDLVGDGETAQRYYRAVLAAGQNDEASRRLALSQAVVGDRQGMEVTLSPLLQRQDKAAWRTRAFALAVLGKPEEAEAIARSTMPADMAVAMGAYLRYMPRLTPSQQVAAGNLGRFPRAADIGRDDPRVAQYARPKAALALAEPPARSTAATRDRGTSRSARRAAEREASRRDSAQRAAAARETPKSAVVTAAPAAAASQAPVAPVPTRTAQVAVATPPPTAVATPQAVAALAPATPPVTVARTPSAAPVAAASPPPVAIASGEPARVLPGSPPSALPAPAPVAVTVPPAAIVAARPTAITPSPAAPSPAAPAPVQPGFVALDQGSTAAGATGFDLGQTTGSTASNGPGTPPKPAEIVAAAPPAAAVPIASPPPQSVPSFTPPSPPPAVASPPPPTPARPQTLTDLFADLSVPSREIVPAAGAVDIRRITPRRPAAEPREDAAKTPPVAAKPAPPSHPSRIWVQVATGRDKAALGFDWRRMAREDADVFRGRKPFASAIGQSTRLLTGPFESQAAASAFVAQLRRAGVDGAHVWTSPAGQVVDALGSK